MYFVRLIIIALAVWAVIVLGRQLLQRTRPSARGNAGPRKRVASQPMVKCDVCGVHVPADEAVTSGSRTYCSTEHRLEDRRRE